MLGLVETYGMCLSRTCGARVCSPLSCGWYERLSERRSMRCSYDVAPLRAIYAKFHDED